MLKDGPGAVVKLLLPLLPMGKADNKQYGLLLQMVVMAGDRECVEPLLQRQIDVNAVGRYYGTALQVSARVCDVDLVHLLLHVSAEVNVLQGRRSTALRAAVRGAHEEIVETLIKHGIDVNLRSQEEDQHEQSSPFASYLMLEPETLPSPNPPLLRKLT